MVKLTPNQQPSPRPSIAEVLNSAPWVSLEQHFVERGSCQRVATGTRVAFQAGIASFMSQAQAFSGVHAKLSRSFSHLPKLRLQLVPEIRQVLGLIWKFAQGFYDDIESARGEMANRSGVDQQLTY